MAAASRSRDQGKARPARVRSYPPLDEYGLIGDCHSAALVHRSGSIDWCCMPRFDAASVFGRLLDWGEGGFCEIRPTQAEASTSRSYLEGTMILVTTFRSHGGEVRLYDCIVMRRGGSKQPQNQILRIVEGVRGRMALDLRISPRLDYAECRPWIRQHAQHLYSAIGGNDALVIWSEADIQPAGKYDLSCSFEVNAGAKVRTSIQYVAPQLIDDDPPEPLLPEVVDRRFEETSALWRRWWGKGRLEGPDEESAKRSAIVLKALSNAPTGAIAAAPTTSLPESMGGARNWDYRFSWVRDSSFTVRSLAELGHESEADGFRRFVERSSAGSSEEIQVLFGMGGERRVGESILSDLEGYRGSKPVRIGNGAQRQFQLDVYGHLLDLSYLWHQRGHSPDDDYWRFLHELCDAAARWWSKPDRGIWETRGRLRHFVHSKVMAWAALDRGITLARECSRKAPERRWARIRDEIRAAVETRGYDRRRGVFVQVFGTKAMDAALLLLPTVGFVDYRDERMVRTTDAIMEDLTEDGLLKRYRGRDGLQGEEGVFLACSFWLVECLAGQGRLEAAREVFDRAVSTGNDLGLFSEEYDVGKGEMLGNFPQGLTHLSHIAAAVALTRAEA